jgi:glycosyltransferase involved in cell wall biosynthesis
VILSFGFMDPSKGYELAIDALPAVVHEHPSVLYAILGATSPGTKQPAGEAYRQSLVSRVRDLDLVDNVRFVDSFVGHGELTRWLEAADIFASPYTDAWPTVSGPLAYAMGTGRAIVSTAYPYARELLADERGVVISERSAEGFAAALNRLLGDDDARREYGRRAYEYSRPMVWSEVGAAYERLSARIVSEARRPKTVRVA